MFGCTHVRTEAWNPPRAFVLRKRLTDVAGINDVLTLTCKSKHYRKAVSQSCAKAILSVYPSADCPSVVWTGYCVVGAFAEFSGGRRLELAAYHFFSNYDCVKAIMSIAILSATIFMLAGGQIPIIKRSADILMLIAVIVCGHLRITGKLPCWAVVAAILLFFV